VKKKRGHRKQQDLINGIKAQRTLSLLVSYSQTLFASCGRSFGAILVIKDWLTATVLLFEVIN
jgi:hypothetical protein